MKVNYENEECKGVLFGIVMCVIIMIIITVWGIKNSIIEIDMGIIIFVCLWNIFMAVLLIVLMRDYKKRREQRERNLFIIKNGNCIKGKVFSIYDNYTTYSIMDRRQIHNVTAKINYTINGENKLIVVDKLCLDRNRLKEYENKNVNIYIYDNMSYVDIAN